MSDAGQYGPPDEVRGAVPPAPPYPAPVAVPATPVVPASVSTLAVVEETCQTPPTRDITLRRFWAIVIPSIAVSALAWFALAVWGGGKEMRRGLLTGGPALMTHDGMEAVQEHATHATLAAAGISTDAAALPDVAEHAGHAGHGSMTMLGVEMGDLSPASLGYAGLFLWMWAVMVVAMMLPATLPSVRVFFAGDRTRRHAAGAVFLSGCIATWVVAGLAVYGILVGLDLALDERVGAESRAALTVGAVALLAAGIFQFSQAKEKVLNHVRGPFSCGSGSWKAGLHHGRRCLLSCGPYMLGVALIGMMSLFWMAVFALVMAVEQVAEMLAGKGMVVARVAGAVTVLVAMGLFLSPTPLPLVG